MLNKIEIKGPVDTQLWVVTIWVGTNPAGTYVYKTEPNARARYQALTGGGTFPRVTLHHVRLDWETVESYAKAEP
jgi:hypothetical protein